MLVVTAVLIQSFLQCITTNYGPDVGQVYCNSITVDGTQSWELMYQAGMSMGTGGQLQITAAAWK